MQRIGSVSRISTEQDTNRAVEEMQADQDMWPIPVMSNTRIVTKEMCELDGERGESLTVRVIRGARGCRRFLLRGTLQSTYSDEKVTIDIQRERKGADSGQGMYTRERNTQGA